MDIFKFSFGTTMVMLVVSLLSIFLTPLDKRISFIFIVIILIFALINLTLLILEYTYFKNLKPVMAKKLSNVWKIEKDEINDGEKLKKIMEEREPEKTNFYEITYKRNLGFLFHEKHDLVNEDDYNELLKKYNLVAVPTDNK